MATRIKLRRDTSANWTDVNPILANGEMGIEADTRRIKLGDGATAWTDLKYAITDQLKISGKTINTEMGVSVANQDPETWLTTVKAKANWAGTKGVAYDSMGNLYLSGWEEFNYDNDLSGSGKAFLIKIDSQGTVLWSKYITTEGYSSGYGVSVDSEDNVIAITTDWDEDFFVVTKFTEDGDVVWQNTVTDSYIWAVGFCLVVDGNDDVIVSGLRPDPNHDEYEALYATKFLGSNGTLQWTRTWGSYSDTYSPSLAVDGSNNIIVAGWQNYGTNGHATLAKFDRDGVFVWGKMIDNPEGGYDGYELLGSSLDADDEGNIYFVGSYIVPDFVTDLSNNTYDGRAGFVLKTNSSGITQWSRLVGPGDCSDMGAQVVYKDGKVYATFQTDRPYYKNDLYRNDNDGYTTQEIVLACYDADNGKVNWQRTFGPEVLWGYANPTGSQDSNQDEYARGGKMLAVYKDYIAVAGQAGEYSRIDDNDVRSYAFVAQLPADGSEMDIAGWHYTKSNHKGTYAKIKTDSNYQYSATTPEDLSVVGNNDYTPEDTDDNVRINLIASGTNQWDFKPNGDLVLPVGGNIEITRPTVGNINVVGYFDSDNNDNIFNTFNSVTTDPEGNKYYVGCWNINDNWTSNGDASLPMIVKVNAQGQIEWKTRLSNSYIYSNNSVDGQATTVAYDPSTSNIVVVCTDSGEGNNEQMLIVDINTQNGDVIDSHRYTGPDDVRAHDITIDTDGTRFVTGSMQGSNNITFAVNNTMVAAGHNDALLVPKTVFSGHAAPAWLEGTNGWYLDGVSNLNNIDYYENVTGTVRQGSGAVFTIGRSSTDYTLDSISTAGANYRADHRILVLGTALGGTTPANDLTIVVRSVNGSGGILTADVYGTALVSGSFPYSAVSGTNVDTGSGFTIDVQVNSLNGNLIVYHNEAGTNYAVGDVVTFSGTDIGGTSPATDIIITVLSVGEFTAGVDSGEDSGYAVTTRGTSPLTVVRLKFDGGPDLSSGGPWNLVHYTDANAFLAKFNPVDGSTSTLNWAKWIEKSNYDVGVAVDYDSDGNLYWASTIYDTAEVGSGDSYYRPTVMKLNSSGVVQWSKTYSYDGYEGFISGLEVDSEDKVVLGHIKWYQNQYEYSPVVQRLNPAGEILWTKRYWLDGGEGPDSWDGSGMDLDNDDNIYFNARRYDGQDHVSWVAKIDIQDGTEIWQQEINNENRGIFHGWSDYGNSIAIDSTNYNLGIFTFDLDGDEGNALAVSLPADGSAADTQVGPFAINETFYGNEGGGNDPVVRTYALTDASLTEVTGREAIRAWIEPGPTSYYPVYSNADAGITFGDGSVQTTSGQGIPQVRHNRYDKQTKLKLSDSGKHLFMRNNEQMVIVPTYSEVQFPVGTVITIVNLSGGWVYVAAAQDSGRTTLYCPTLDGNEGSYGYYRGWRFEDNGGGNLITLLKVEESYSNGSRWIITGNNGQLWN